jgi:hypothetical protein
MQYFGSINNMNLKKHRGTNAEEHKKRGAYTAYMFIVQKHLLLHLVVGTTY